jgi:hypothetical protein
MPITSRQSPVLDTDFMNRYLQYLIPFKNTFGIRVLINLNNLVIFRLTSGNVYFRYLYHVNDTIVYTLEVQMKQWISGIILSADDLREEESAPYSNKEFTISLSMVCAALALFGIIVRVLGA